MWPKNEANSALRLLFAHGGEKKRTERKGCARPAPFACLEKVELRGVFEFLSYAATGPRSLARFRSFQKMFPIHPRVFPSSSSSSFSFAFSRSVYTNVGPLTPPPPFLLSHSAPTTRRFSADFEHQAALNQQKLCTNATGSVRGAARAFHQVARIISNL